MWRNAIPGNPSPGGELGGPNRKLVGVIIEKLTLYLSSLEVLISCNAAAPFHFVALTNTWC